MRKDRAARLFLVALVAVGVQTCGDAPVAPESPESIGQLERELEASGHLECRDLVRDLWSRLDTLSRRGRRQEIGQVARECVRGLRYGMFTVVTTTTGDGTDPDGYEITLGTTTLPVSANGMVTFENVRNGRREVTLGGLAPHCTVVGNPRGSDVVTPHRPGRVAFEIVCGEQDGGPEPLPVDLPYDLVSCPDLSLSRTSGITLDRVIVAGVPTDFASPLAARVLFSGRDTETFALLEETDSGASLVVPLHPLAPLAGGDLELVLTDGSLACPPAAFTIEPLPPASGELGRIVDQVQEVVRDQAAVLGTTPEALMATPPEDLPSFLVPLALVQMVIDHPANPNSLDAIARGASPLVAEEELDVLNRLLARAGLQDALAGVRGESEFAPSRALRLTSFGIQDCDLRNSPATPPNTAEWLDFCMDAAAKVLRQLEGGAQAQILSDVMDAAAIAGLAPHAGAEIAAAVVGLVAFAIHYAMERSAATLPTSFTSMTFKHDPTLLEDQPSGRWSDAEVTAASTGTDDFKVIITLVVQLASVIRPLEKFSENITTRLIEDVLFLLNTKVIEELLDRYGGLGKITPETFGPVTVTHDDWSESRIVVGDAVELSSHTTYVPRRPKETAILSVRTEDGEFGGQQISRQEEIEVKQLQVHISPDRLILTDEEFFIFDVTVTNSFFPEMVEIDEGVSLSGNASISYQGDGLHKVDYVPPSSLESLPDLLTVRHSAETGARNPEFEPQERNAVAVIAGGTFSITISPSSDCVEFGETQQFEVQGIPADRVEWTVEGEGTVDANGVFTAMGTATESLVIVTSLDDPTVSATASVRISEDCSCDWSVTVDGTTVASTPGDSAVFGFNNQEEGNPVHGIILAQTNPSSPDPGTFRPWIASTGFTTPGIVEPGVYLDVMTHGTIGVDPDFDNYTSLDLSYHQVEGDATTPLVEVPVSVDIEITEHTSTSLIGTALGQVWFSPVWQGDAQLVPFSANFTIAAPPDFEFSPTTFTVRCEVR